MLCLFQKTEVNMLLFIADNMACFPFQTQEEPLFIMHHIDITLSVSGSNLMQSFKEVKGFVWFFPFIVRWKCVTYLLSTLCLSHFIFSSSVFKERTCTAWKEDQAEKNEEEEEEAASEEKTQLLWRRWWRWGGGGERWREQQQQFQQQRWGGWGGPQAKEICGFWLWLWRRWWKCSNGPSTWKPQRSAGLCQRLAGYCVVASAQTASKEFVWLLRQVDQHP